MDTVYLNGEFLKDRAEAIEVLEQALALPEWWGWNLDALHDCLTDLGRPVRLAELGSRLFALDGVENYHFTTPTEDLAADDGVLPVLGELEVTPMEETAHV